MSDEDPFNHDGAYMDRGNGTPVLRADATDDDLDIPDSEEPPAGEPGTVEPELRVKARLVPVVVNGVLHGYREEE